MKTLIALICSLAVSVIAADFVIYPYAITAGHVTGTICPAPYTWRSSYTNHPPANFYGWKMDPNESTHTVTDTNSPNTKVQWGNFNSSNGCAQTTASIPFNPVNAASQYRFAGFGTNNQPVNTNYPLVLHGFLP